MNQYPSNQNEDNSNDDFYQGVNPPRDEIRQEGTDIGVIRELSPKKVKEHIRMDLKGFDYDEQERRYIKRDGFEPLLNDKGIAKFINALPALSDTVTFSNYTAEQISKLVVFSMEQVIPSIYINYKEYGIKNKCDLPILTNMLFTITLGAYNKALGAGDRGVIGKVTTENIVSRGGQYNPMQQQPERRNGFFSNLNPFRK